MAVPPRARVPDALRAFNPVLIVVAAAALILFGVLIIARPQVLVWAVGIASILVGVALAAVAFVLVGESEAKP